MREKEKPEKVRLKLEYKQLVRNGKTTEAHRVLEKIWKLCGITIPKGYKKKKYTKEELENLSFKELKKIGAVVGTTDRSKKNLIKEILSLQ